MIETSVRFARERTAYVWLMYRPELSETGKDPNAEASNAALLSPP
ncbi:hypothetical protein [Actinoplanes couchii]|uniref:Uncharacterized protein n=1 Tax=Actinoplanes couchii TaxID=403638 RepID=A0ABQ3XEV9_9ACTN|nr:hypothetical protein [Actinoplanes couchii]MDR6319904.1 hypothetical protein [Actinoplanes couchii]GID57041.1 hypothetical protein Aco03nite_054450 [Actinoplanes couchii]